VSLPQGEIAHRRTYWFCKHQLGLRLIVDTLIDDKVNTTQRYKLLQGGAVAFDGHRIRFHEYTNADAERFYTAIHLNGDRQIDWPYRPSIY
tara:strand:- start:782 stop:1054 length:273 start_codon:yes stop_codon:yes gene_type:complete